VAVHSLENGRHVSYSVNYKTDDFLVNTGPGTFIFGHLLLYVSIRRRSGLVGVGNLFDFAA
jgi:hypothetical protein